MQRRILIRGARQLLTLRGPALRRGRQLSDLGIIPDGSVLIVGDRIHSVGATRRMENLKEARGAEEIDATGKVVMPGFVDSHTHLVFAAPRLADFERRIAAAASGRPPDSGGFPPAHAPQTVTSQRLEWATAGWLRRFAACGTTTLEGKSGYGLNLAAKTKILGVMKRLAGRPVDVVRTFLGAHLLPPAMDAYLDDYVSVVVDKMLPAVRRRRLAEFCDVLCDAGAFNLDQCRRILVAARALGLRLKLLAGPSVPAGAAGLAVELGATSIDHLEQLGDEPLRVLAASSTVLTLLPGPVFHLGRDRYPPARPWIDAGAAVALATGFNPDTSPTVNMQMILALACSHMKMTPAEAISAATVNAAAALGRSSTVGSLAPEKFADLILLDASDYREIPYYFGMNLCRMTMWRGEVIKPSGDSERGGLQIESAD